MNTSAHQRAWEDHQAAADLAELCGRQDRRRAAFHHVRHQLRPRRQFPAHGLIQQPPDQDHRARVWQWFVDNRLVQRTLITETRVAKDWR